jgi:hypothetical protein
MARSDEVTIHSYGRRVDSEFPEGVLGYLQPHEYPDEKQIATARQYFPQAELGDFEIRETGPGRALFVSKETGQEFRRDESLPLMARDPQASGVACFVIDAAGRIHYLRPRGPRAPQESIQVSSYVVGRRLS